MKRQHDYEQIIAHKLNGITRPGTTAPWSNMEAILDREMPQQQEKNKRFVGSWWLRANVLFAVSLVAAAGTVYILCRALVSLL